MHCIKEHPGGGGGNLEVRRTVQCTENADKNRAGLTFSERKGEHFVVYR